jgi:hypothetical protein
LCVNPLLLLLLSLSLALALSLSRSLTHACIASIALETDPAELGYDTFTIGQASGSVRSYEGPGKPNVAWLSALSLSDGSTASRASITAFVGPLSDVPHLLASCAVVDGSHIELLIDFRVRAECAYTADGLYEDPTTREAFAMSGNRKDFEAAFFNDDAVAWRDGLLALEGAEHTALATEEMAAQSAGPLRTCLRLPLTDAAASAAADACTAASRRWLEWMLSAESNKRVLPAGAKQTATYARDTKLRAALYGWLLDQYTSAYGDEGKGLAAVDAGPLDEAYVGGAS